MIIFAWLFSLLKIVAILGTLITIHELGHFLVAKACNVKVHKFAIGFGPKLFTKVAGETEYTLRLIPFGGFVQMEGEEGRSEDSRAFNNKPVWQRILIVAAGATVNIVFALIIYFGIASFNNSYFSTNINNLSEGPLYEAGIQSGDTVLKVNGKKVLMQGDIEDKIATSESDDMVFTVERNGVVLDIPVNIPYEDKGYLGVAFSNSGEVLYIVNGSPAAEMGIELGDVANSINGMTFSTTEEMVKEIRKIKNEEIIIGLTRSGEAIELVGTTETTNQRVYSFGCEIIKPGFPKSIRYAWDATAHYFIANIVGTIEIFTGKAENVEVLGPLGIAEKISETNAWEEFFYLMSAISLSLGIFNLIPIPALDGGRILILIIEAIRRKPMKEIVEQNLIMAGFVAIMLLAVVITVSDIIKIF